MNSGPSSGFMSRMKQNMPGMINAVGSQYGGAASGASKLAGGMMGNRMKPPQRPGVNPSQGMPNNPMSGINVAPSQPPVPIGGPPSMMGSGFMNPNMAPQIMGSPDMGGLWGNYNNVTMPGIGDRYPQQVPGLNRQVIY